MPIVYVPRSPVPVLTDARRGAMLDGSRTLLEGSEILLAIGATRLQLSRERIAKSLATAHVNAWACRRRANPDSD